MDFIEHLPDHPLNETLIEHAAPRDWVNPTPQDDYHLVVIGGGSAGLVATSAAAQLGARVALIEKGVLGGDCLNVGCVPSKAIIRAGKVAADMKKGAKFGVSVPADQITVDFAKVMEHVWSARAHIAPHDSAKRFTDLGADVFFGTGTFIDGNTIDVDGQKLKFRKALIATGSGPRHIPIPGLADVGYLTNESLWNVTTQPESLAVIGAGPIGAELAQSFQRLGTQVTLIDLAPQILIREDRDAADIVQNALVSDGVNLCLGASTKQVSARDGKKVLEIEQGGETKQIVVDDILLAVGRAPNINGLNLEAAGVEYTKKGVTVDDTLRTTNKNVYAAGDVAMKYQFTHAAGHAAGIVIQNALFPNPKKLKVSDLIMPWATYTDPEVAHVGLYENCLLYTSPSPRDLSTSRMPSSA